MRDDTKRDISSMAADVICGLAQEDNPFREFPWDTSKNIFTEALDFGLTHTPDIIKLIATLSKTDSGLDDKSVYKVSFLYSLLVSSASPRKNSSFFKLMTLMLKSSGCTGQFIDKPNIIYCLNNAGKILLFDEIIFN